MNVEALANFYADAGGATQAEWADAHEHLLRHLEAGTLRAATADQDGAWTVHAWVKQAILLGFRRSDVVRFDGPGYPFFDKQAYPPRGLDAQDTVRLVPGGSAVRRGAHLARGVVVMPPAYINVGAYVGEGSMIDSHALVGSCAQVGARVHLSGGVGIGGVLEPPQAAPVVIEDDCFIGSRCIVVEGVRVRAGAVLGAGVVLTASTTIVDVRGANPVEIRGVVPPRAVVIPGHRRKQFPAGEFGVPCALIIGTRSESTDRKTSLNDALREYGVSG